MELTKKEAKGLYSSLIKLKLNCQSVEISKYTLLLEKMIIKLDEVEEKDVKESDKKIKNEVSLRNKIKKKIPVVTKVRLNANYEFEVVETNKENITKKQGKNQIISKADLNKMNVKKSELGEFESLSKLKDKIDDQLKKKKLGNELQMENSEETSTREKDVKNDKNDIEKDEKNTKI